jgi:chemotaxis protein methyltransferase CheR
VTPGGYLWVGHSESLHDVGAPVRTVVPTVYQVHGGARA